MADTIVKSGSSRIFTIQFRARHDHAPMFHGFAVAGSLDYGQGDVTSIEVPDPTRYNSWLTASEFQGAADRVTLPLTFRLTYDLSEVLKLAKLRCAFDVQIHLGACTDPRDFDLGYEKVQVFENALISSYGTTDIGAMSGDDQAGIDEEVEISARTMYEIIPMRYSEVAAGFVGQEIVAISNGDEAGCGDCADPSDGCSKIFALANAPGSSPGVLAEVIATNDGFSTVVESPINTLTLADNVSDGAVVSDSYVVISNETNSLHYATLDDILDGEIDPWTEVTAGFVIGGEPNAIVSVSPLDTWIVGDGGYVYFSASPADGVEVMDAGSATAEDLHDVDAYDTDNIVAVGNNNAVVYTIDGSTFSAVTGPAPGVNLTAVAMRGEKEWWVGTANGKVYVTTDRGEHWTEKGLKGSPASIQKIGWSNETVGFIAAATAAPAARLYRTINGGYSWTLDPRATVGILPAADRINDFTFCPNDPNKIYAGGLADDASDGIIIKGQ